MRNLFRLLAFDIVAPLATIGALLMIGVVLGWPLWWVSACSVLVMLIVEGVGANFWLLRRDSVSVGTDDDAPGLRLAVAFLCAAALSAAVLTGYTHWPSPTATSKRIRERWSRSPGDGRGDGVVRPGRADRLARPGRGDDGPGAGGRVQGAIQKVQCRNGPTQISAQATTLAAGVEALGPSVASVAVIVRVAQNTPGQPPSRGGACVAGGADQAGQRLAGVDVVPMNSR